MQIIITLVTEHSNYQFPLACAPDKVKHYVWFLFTSGIRKKIISAVKMYVAWIIFWAQKSKKKTKYLEWKKNLFFRKYESYETLVVTFSWNLYCHWILTVTTCFAYYFKRMYLFYITQDRWLEMEPVCKRSIVPYTSITQRIKKTSAHHVKDREHKCFQRLLKFQGIFP